MSSFFKMFKLSAQKCKSKVQVKNTLVQTDHSPSCFGKTHLMAFSLT